MYFCYYILWISCIYLSYIFNINSTLLLLLPTNTTTTIIYCLLINTLFCYSLLINILFRYYLLFIDYLFLVLYMDYHHLWH
ncbi:hypothetical protein H8356DRAFT_1730485 [Neocallimastix lanati (nom. inval.)]|nr:hypothetical protein H8356DRAFT_1730485 [Neocallimastix sp. JGI-2020a]